MEKKNCRFAKEDIVAIDALAERLAQELNMADVLDDDVNVEAGADDVVPIVEEEAPAAPVAGNEEDIVAEAEKMIADAEVPDDKEIVGDHDVQDVLKEADELEKEIDAQEVVADADALEKELDACTTAGESCPDCGKEPCECNKEASEKVASEVKPGIEDKIGDEANGGDPSVSDIVDNTVDTATDKEVFGQNTDSEYVAKITARLDRVANALEKRGMKKMAFRIDQLSDRLEASIR